jgi:uncharacterized membrane protein YdjX (TVP38/TMEM64 family)
MLVSLDVVSPIRSSSSLGFFMKKIAVLVLVIALVLAFFAFDLNQLLTLDGLKAGLAQIKTLRTESPVMVALVYFAGYVVVTALSLPGAVIMTLAGGALFGLAAGQRHAHRAGQ